MADEIVYDINRLAKELKTKPNLIRIRLRRKNIKKPGKSYRWKNKTEFDAIVKKLKVDDVAPDKKAA